MTLRWGLHRPNRFTVWLHESDGREWGSNVIIDLDPVNSQRGPYEDSERVYPGKPWVGRREQLVDFLENVW